MADQEIRVFDPSELDSHEWRELQTISREAFSRALPYRSRDEIDALVGWDDPARFLASHLDPNSEVGKRYNAGQSFANPQVAVAIENDDPVGFAYSALNVSGSEMAQMLKKLSVVKDYCWLREVAVLPDYQRRGLATKLSRALLRRTVGLHPVTTYIWPGEIGFLQPALEKRGFVPTGEQYVKIFGEDSKPIRQVRMQARTARSARRSFK